MCNVCKYKIDKHEERRELGAAVQDEVSKRNEKRTVDGIVFRPVLKFKVTKQVC